MDKGDPILNVPTYNGGLFNTTPDKSDSRDQRIARFLLETQAARIVTWLSPSTGWQWDRTSGLWPSSSSTTNRCEVRHLGSIYEGLLEFKLKVADEDHHDPGRQKKARRTFRSPRPRPNVAGRPEIVVRKREVYSLQ